MEVDKLGAARGVSPALTDYRPTDPQIAWHLARFIENVRGRPADPIVLRQNLNTAYDFTTEQGAAALNDYARGTDPFATLADTQVSVDVKNVVRASADSFRIAWDERRYDHGQLSATTHWSAILTVVVRTPTDAASTQPQPARALRPRHQLVSGPRRMIMRLSLFASALLLSTSALAAPRDRGIRPVAAATQAARVEPRPHGWQGASQLFSYAPGGLYQVYAAVGQVTDIMLQEGETLSDTGAVAAGDTVRWVIGEASSGIGPTRRTPHPGQADRSGVEDQPRHQHRPPHLPCRDPLDLGDLHGERRLVLSAGRAHRGEGAHRSRQPSRGDAGAGRDRPGEAGLLLPP